MCAITHAHAQTSVLQHTATHNMHELPCCNTHHTYAQPSVLQRTSLRCNTQRRHKLRRRNTLQHTHHALPCCNTLQHAHTRTSFRASLLSRNSSPPPTPPPAGDAAEGVEWRGMGGGRASRSCCSRCRSPWCCTSNAMSASFAFSSVCVYVCVCVCACV